MHSLTHKSRAILMLVVCALPGSIHKASGQSLPAKPSPIQLSVSVTDSKGNFVTGLQSDDFIVLDGRQPLRVLSAVPWDVPMSIGILVDASGSTENSRYGIEKKQRVLIEALRRFIVRSLPSNEYFVIGFNDRPQLLLDWTSDSDAVLSSISEVKPKGQTAFYDACYLGVEKVMKGKYQKRAVILISDGINSESHYTFGEVKNLLRMSDVRVYSLNIMDASAGSVLAVESKQVLEELSSISGGLAFYETTAKRLTPNDVYAFLAAIAGDLQQLYRLEVEPINSQRRREWHDVKVKINKTAAVSPQMKNLSIRTSKGYYLN